MSGEEALNEVKKLAEKVADAKAAYQETKDVAETASKAFTAAKAEFMAVLDAAGMSRFDACGFTFSMKEKRSVKTPKAPEDREAFFQFLKDKGCFEEMVSVNSQTLNSWFNAEEEIAAAKGELFQVPGLNEVTTYNELSIRAAK